jgi:hypothetical protein
LLAFFELTMTGQGSDLLADTLQKYEEIRTIQLESP